jgi:hypothetical protein
MEKGMRIYDETGDVVALFSSVKRDKDKLVVDGKALGSMRMDMIITVDELFNGLRLALCWGVITFILLMPYFCIRKLFKRNHD